MPSRLPLDILGAGGTAIRTHRPPTAQTLGTLARHLAARAHAWRAELSVAFAAEAADGPRHRLLDRLRAAWLPELTPDDFLDLYVQALCCGLFTARGAAPPGAAFTGGSWTAYLPPLPPALAALFAQAAAEDTAPLVALLHRSRFAGAPDEAAWGVQFYEAFLAAYRPRQRAARGVYFTPEPAVSYLVRSVDALLRHDFGLPDGLADAGTVNGRHRVQLLDPAAGTGAFLAGILTELSRRVDAPAAWRAYLAADLLPRLTGCELLPAACAAAHLLLGGLLAQQGGAAAGALRLLPVDILREAPALPPCAAGGDTILCVLGNPPYAGHSANTGAWISALLRGTDTLTGAATASYAHVDGQPLPEQNRKWLQDDYVKFLRLAQWGVARAGRGIVAFVCNHGFLDNPTCRGLRQSLLHAFDAIYLLNLHGSVRKRERTPDGRPDENLFGIQQGVCLAILVKSSAEPAGTAAVRYADLWGTRREKLDALARQDAATTAWTALPPVAPHYRFVPDDAAVRREYDALFAVTDIFHIRSLGLLSKRDGLVVGFSPAHVLEQLACFTDPARSDAAVAAQFALPRRDRDRWDLPRARQVAVRREAVQPLAYRPFDRRAIYYDDAVVARPNRRVLSHLREGNPALLLGRQGGAVGSESWDVVFAVDTLVDQNIFRRGGGTVFPLSLHPGTAAARPNLTAAFLDECAARLGQPVAPDDAFAYLYAVLHAPGYRRRYAVPLRYDFPRLPVTAQPRLFHRLCGAGRALLALHLGRTARPPVTPCPAGDAPIVERVRYTPPHAGAPGRVWIDARQGIDGVPPAVWAFRIGGYRVCEKWLKDRAGRPLTAADLAHYRHLVAALAETLRLMAEIDAAIDAHGGWPMR